MTLRKKLVKLAYENKNLRPHLLPLLKTGNIDPQYSEVLEGALEYLRRIYFEDFDQRDVRDMPGSGEGFSGGEGFFGTVEGISRVEFGSVPLKISVFAGPNWGDQIQLGYSFMKGEPGAGSVMGGRGKSDAINVNTPDMRAFTQLLKRDLGRFLNS